MRPVGSLYWLVELGFIPRFSLQGVRASQPSPPVKARTKKSGKMIATFSKGLPAAADFDY